MGKRALAAAGRAAAAIEDPAAGRRRVGMRNTSAPGTCPGAHSGKRRAAPFGRCGGDRQRSLPCAGAFERRFAVCGCECLRRGFVTASGGVRVGFCGRIPTDEHELWSGGDLNSICIRIPREVQGIGAQFCRRPFPSTLILSPPGIGKTTLLRDMIRTLSDGGMRVGLCDERGEIAALSDEGCAFDVGEETDVLSDCSKACAAMILLRCMSPELIAMDEISEAEDAEACRSAAYCGVSLLATAHAADIEELERREIYRRIQRDRVFRRAVVIRMADGRRVYEEVML